MSAQGARDVVAELVIDAFAQDHLDQDARNVSLEADLDAYRLLAQEAIHRLRAVTQQLDSLRAQHYRVIDEYRALRVQTLRRDQAA